MVGCEGGRRRDLGHWARGRGVSWRGTLIRELYKVIILFISICLIPCAIITLIVILLRFIVTVLKFIITVILAYSFLESNISVREGPQRRMNRVRTARYFIILLILLCARDVPDSLSCPFPTPLLSEGGRWMCLSLPS